MRMIPVGEYFATVDDEDWERLTQFKWNPLIVEDNIYAQRSHKRKRRVCLC